MTESPCKVKAAMSDNARSQTNWGMDTLSQEALKKLLLYLKDDLKYLPKTNYYNTAVKEIGKLHQDSARGQDGA